MIKTIVAFCLVGFLLMGCAHSIHEVHFSDFQGYAPMEKGKIVKANSEQFVVLWVATETNYVDQAYRKLQAQCPKGEITGISTQLSTSLGFLSWTNKALMQGLCI